MANVFAIRFSVKIRKACGAFAKLNLPLGKMVLKKCCVQHQYQVSICRTNKPRLATHCLCSS
jgi:hypothetical protein